VPPRDVPGEPGKNIGVKRPPISDPDAEKGSKKVRAVLREKHREDDECPTKKYLACIFFVRYIVQK